MSWCLGGWNSDAKKEKKNRSEPTLFSLNQWNVRQFCKMFSDVYKFFKFQGKSSWTKQAKSRWILQFTKRPGYANFAFSSKNLSSDWQACNLLGGSANSKAFERFSSKCKSCKFQVWNIHSGRSCNFCNAFWHFQALFANTHIQRF